MSGEEFNFLVNSGIAGLFAVFAIMLFDRFIRYLNTLNQQWQVFLEAERKAREFSTAQTMAELVLIKVELSKVNMQLSSHDQRVVDELLPKIEEVANREKSRPIKRS